MSGMTEFAHMLVSLSRPEVSYDIGGLAKGEMTSC